MPSKPSKKTFTDSDGAVERFFINSPKEQAQTESGQTENENETETPVWIDPQTEECPEQAQPTQKTPVMPHTQDSYDAQQTQAQPQTQVQSQLQTQVQSQPQTQAQIQVQPQPQTQSQDTPIITTPAAAEKGLRKERIGLLLDAQLKEDLAHLSKATGSKSLNDFLVTMLTAYAESPESREKLTKYRRLLQD